MPTVSITEAQRLELIEAGYEALEDVYGAAGTAATAAGTALSYLVKPASLDWIMKAAPWLIGGLLFSRVFRVKLGGRR